MATHEEQMRDLIGNRVLFLRLLEENTAAKFHEMLAEHPMHIHMCCNSDGDELSDEYTLLHLAAQLSLPEHIEALLAFDVNVNIRSKASV